MSSIKHSVLIIDTEAEYYREKILAAGVDVSIHAVSHQNDAFELVSEASVICGLSPVFSDELFGAAKQLQWVQALTTGVDTIVNSGALPSQITVTNMRGIHGPQMAELAIMQMMALGRNARKFVENKERRTWERWAQPVLEGKTVAIFGLGEISYALARCLKAFNMEVIGVTSTPNRALENFDAVEHRDNLAEVAKSVDFLVMLAPWTPKNEKIVGAAILSAMKPSAFLLNLGRGGTVDEAALYDALTNGVIAGAALDVFKEEPLPETSSLWTAPNLLITPHIGGMSTTYSDQALPILIENLRGFLQGKRGQSLKNCVLARASELVS